MSTAVTAPKGAAVAALAGLRQSLQTVVSAMPSAPTQPILKLGKDGIWAYGKDNTEVEEGSRWAINPLSIRQGLQSWAFKEHPRVRAGEIKANTLLGERFVGLSEPAIVKSALPDTGAEWKETFIFDMRCMSGEDAGEQVVYKPNSVGGIDAARAILNAILGQLAAGSDEVVPIVTLDSTHYQHPTYGKTYKPKVDIVAWTTLDGETSDDGAAEPDAPVEEKAADPKPEDKAPVEDAEVIATTQPTRRRNRG